jgi:Na+-translocating ferredoxin:NAD+ oxidoreductase RnfE subunit
MLACLMQVMVIFLPLLVVNSSVFSWAEAVSAKRNVNSKAMDLKEVFFILFEYLMINVQCSMLNLLEW